MRYLACLVAGVLAGIALGLLLQPQSTLSAIGLEPTAEAADQTSRAPTLSASAGVRRAGDHAASGGTDGEEVVEEEIEEIDEAWGPWQREPARPETPGSRARRGILAHATLHALAGRQDLLMQDAKEALDAGASGDDVLEACLALPTEAWPRVVEALQAAHPDIEWSAVTLADHGTRAGADAWSWNVLVHAFSNSSQPTLYLVGAMVDRDVGNTATLVLDRLRADANQVDADVVYRVLNGWNRKTQAREVASFVRAALESMPANDKLLQALADVDPRAAEGRARLRIATDPTDAVALRVLGDLLEARHDASAALDAWVKLAEAAPTRAILRTVLLQDRTQGLLLARRAAEERGGEQLCAALGEAYLENGRLEEAADAYVRAYRADPSDYEWLRAMVELSPQRAGDELSKWTDVPGASDEVVGAYGNVLRGQGRVEEAWTHYLRAWHLDRGDPEWPFRLAETDALRALPLLRERHEAVPGDANIAGALGLAEASLPGTREEGLQRLEEAAKQEGSWRICVTLCRAAPVRGDAVIRSLVQREPRNDEWWGILGELHASRGETAQALACYSKARGLDPDDAMWPRRIALLRAAR